MADTERDRLVGELEYNTNDSERRPLIGLIDLVVADFEHDDRDLLEARLLECIEVLEKRLSGEPYGICGIIRKCLEMKIGDHSAMCAEDVVETSTPHIYRWTDLPSLIRARFDDFAAEFDDFEDPFDGEMRYDDYVSSCLDLLGARLSGLEREMCGRLNRCVRRKIEADSAWLLKEVE